MATTLDSTRTSADIAPPPKPTRPWRRTWKARGIDLLAMLIALGGSALIVAVTEMQGRLAYVGMFFLLITVLNAAVAYLRQGRKAISDAIVTSLIYTAIALVVFPLVSLLYTLIQRGIHAFTAATLTQDMSITFVDAPATEGGLLHALVGTMVLVLIATALSVPIGILTALYLTEIRGRFSGLIRFLVQAMAGVPSIVAGLFIYASLILSGIITFNGFAGASALAILMLPTVARTAEEVLKLIPEDLREAGLALGATQWRTVSMVVVPAARSGLVTAGILGVARVAGETAPLLFTIFGTTVLRLNPFDGPISALPLFVFQLFASGTEQAVDRAWTAALVLMIFVAVLFTLARVAGGKNRT